VGEGGVYVAVGAVVDGAVEGGGAEVVEGFGAVVCVVVVFSPQPGNSNIATKTRPVMMIVQYLTFILYPP
jgi:hypothetical protein